MKVKNNHFRTIWVKEDNPKIIQIIDQRFLPHKFIIEDIEGVDQMAIAISEMHLRGAGLIGAAGGYGMYLAALEASRKEQFDKELQESADRLNKTRPTSVNLSWAITRQQKAMAKGLSPKEKINIAFETANAIADEDVSYSRKIGEHGVKIIQDAARKKKGKPVNILTHCNAGWLAFVDRGTATAPLYAANDKGIPIHVWVDETRPRNQGAQLTAWELQGEGIPHTVIADNTGGHLMQKGLVDVVIVGSDRTTYTGDVCNKIGTYLKALAAKDNGVPFYVALPSSSIDWAMRDGLQEIPIEERNPDEVKYIRGFHDGEIKEVLLTPKESRAANYAFDVTPCRLVTGLITERGLCQANEESILNLYPECKPLIRT